MAHVFGLSPKTRRRGWCAVRGRAGRAVTPSKLLALSGPLPSGVRPGPDVTRRGVSAGPAVWVKVVEAVRPFPSPPSNTAEDGKCPPSRFDNAVFSWQWTAQRPIRHQLEFHRRIGYGCAQAGGRETECARRERVSSEREKIVWPLLRRPLPAGWCRPTQNRFRLRWRTPPLPVVPLLHGSPQPTSQKTNTT